jgi:hypothetical protein
MRADGIAFSGSPADFVESSFGLARSFVGGDANPRADLQANSSTKAYAA